LFLRLLKTEPGYSLLEVIVAMLLLTVAIILMVGMFDAGLKAAIQGSDYDKARALANKQLKTARSLPYEDVRDDFPVSSSTPILARESTNLRTRPMRTFLVSPTR